MKKEMRLLFRCMWVRCKKASADPMVILLFLVLNIVFFSVLLLYVYDVGTRGFIYEQSYSKQIALMIDNARPEMSVLLDVNKGLEIARKNGRDLSSSFVLDEDENRVRVNFGAGKGGYSYEYFSDYDIEMKLEGEKILINVLKKEMEDLEDV